MQTTTRAARSFALEVRLPLLEKRLRTLAHVVGRGNQPEQRRLEKLRLVERHFEAAVHRFDDVLHGHRRLRRQFRGQALCIGQQTAGRHDAVYQADLQRFGGGYVSAREQQLQSDALPDQARKTLRTAIAGNDPEVDFRLTDAGRVGRDAQRTRQGQFAPAAEGVPVDRRNDGLAEVFDQVEHVLATQRVFLPLRRGLHGELVDVGAGHERLVARAGNDDRANARIVFQQERRAAQLVDGGEIEGVEHLRAVDGDDGNRAIPGEQEVVKVHRGTGGLY